jgi:alpha-tubulin suppressor-like RCC1 family protein
MRVKENRGFFFFSRLVWFFPLLWWGCGFVVTEPCERANTCGLQILQIVAGEDSTCALLSDRMIRCWGENSYGRLGDGTRTDRSIPVKVRNVTDAVSISMGSHHACAVLADGTVKCWGQAMFGRLGIVTQEDFSAPVEVSGLRDVVSVSAGTVHNCALLKDGTLRCWGNNSDGQLGNGTRSLSNPQPVEVTGLRDVASFAVGSHHTCAALKNGQVKCWGRNNFGQLGTTFDKIEQSSIPVDILDVGHAVSLAAGEEHTCALLDLGTVRCWGASQPFSRDQVAPGWVAELRDVASLSAKGSRNCALLLDGRVKCWGGGIAQWADDRNRGTKPSEVPSLEGVESISVGSFHICALLKNQKAYCWGSNEFWNLGNDGRNISGHLPVLVNVL